MNAGYSENIAKVVLVFFWCIITTCTIPSKPSYNHNAGCACNPGACGCSHESPCHEKNHSRKSSDPILVSAGCQSGSQAIEAKSNLEVYPPITFSFVQTTNFLGTFFLKEISEPLPVFLDPPFKPPILS